MKQIPSLFSKRQHCLGSECKGAQTPWFEDPYCRSSRGREAISSLTPRAQGEATAPAFYAFLYVVPLKCSLT